MMATQMIAYYGQNKDINKSETYYTKIPLLFLIYYK